MIRPISISIDKICSSSNFNDISKVNLLFRCMNDVIRQEKEEYIELKKIMLNESVLKKISRFLKRQGNIEKRIDTLNKYIDACKKIENYNYILASQSSHEELKNITSLEIINLMDNIYDYIEDINFYFLKTLSKPNSNVIYFRDVKSSFEEIDFYLIELTKRHKKFRKTTNPRSNFSYEVKKAFLDLGLKAGDNVSASIIKNQYRKMAKIHHPDRGGDIIQMQKINDAYIIAKSYFDKKIS